VRPAHIDIVTKNYNILASLFSSHSDDFLSFLDGCMSSVYVVLDELITDMLFAINYQPDDVMMEGDVTVSRAQRDQMLKDVAYLMKMKELDVGMQERRRVGSFDLDSMDMCDVVPVCGLLLARFHVTLCEMKSAVELWSHGKDARDSWRQSVTKESIFSRPIAFEEFTGSRVSPPNVLEDQRFLDFASFTISSSPVSLRNSVKAALVRRMSSQLLSEFQDANEDLTQL
jgi:hypothetical protein